MDLEQDCVKENLQHDGILHLSLNQPKQLNALSQKVLEALSTIFSQAKRDNQVRAILLTGEGKGFCAGADIKQLADLNGQDGIEFARYGQAVFRSLELTGKPSIAAIHGFAFGGGCELAMAATMRVACFDAVFGQPEIKLGVIPGFGGTQRLPRLIGKGRALDMCLTGRRISAEEAFQWGLVNALATTDQLIEKSQSILREISSMGAFALTSIMTSIDQGYHLPLDQAMEIEAKQFGLCCETSDKREGVSAFLEKRVATFSGK